MASDDRGEPGLVAADGMRLDVVVHPARVRPRTTVMLLVYLTVTSWLLARFSAPTLGLSVMACAGLVMLAFVVLLRRWFFATRYRFDDAGIEVSGLSPRRYPWSRFRSWRPERGGYALSPFSNPRRFDHFRGIFLPLRNCWSVVNDHPRALPASPGEGSAPSGQTPPRHDPDATLQALLKEKIDGRQVPVP